MWSRWMIVTEAMDTTRRARRAEHARRARRNSAVQVLEVKASETAEVTETSASEVASEVTGPVHAFGTRHTHAHHRPHHGAHHHAGEHAHHHVHPEIATGVGGIGRTRLVVRTSLTVDLDQPNIGQATRAYGLSALGTRGHLTRGTAGRGPHDVGHGRSVLRVEETGTTPLGYRFAVHPGTGGGHVVTTVLQGAGDHADLLGLLNGVQQ